MSNIADHDRPDREATKMVDEMRQTLFLMREQLQKKITHHQEMAEFYTNEQSVITLFLTENVLEMDEAKRAAEPIRDRRVY